MTALKLIEKRQTQFVLHKMLLNTQEKIDFQFTVYVHVLWSVKQKHEFCLFVTRILSPKLFDSPDNPRVHCFADHHRFPARRSSRGNRRTYSRHRKAGRKMADENEIALPWRAMRREGWLRNSMCVSECVCVYICLWWAAGAWKFSPPVAKQFPWKRSYGHGFRRINTARVGNNVPRARVLVRQFARREMRFPYENEEKTAFVDFAAKGTIGPRLH